MLKKFLVLLKRIIFSSFLLYGYNMIVNPLNLMIPINIITIGALTIFGIPALMSFILVYLIVF